MRVVFFGIYRIGLESLKALLDRRIDIVAVVTKPSSLEDVQPVLAAARQQQLPLYAPDTPRDDNFVQQIHEWSPDLIVVAGYHKILPKALLEIPRWGAINLHLSLLPQYRGPCPWKWAIVKGETVTGTTVVMMSQKVDAGAILAQQPSQIDEADTGESLFERLSVSGSRLLADTIEAIQAGTETLFPQEEALANYQSAPTEGDARIQWSKSASCVRNLVRGFFPRPGAWTCYAGVPLVIRKASFKEGHSSSRPGTIIEVFADSFWVATGNGIVALEEIAWKGQRSEDAALLKNRSMQRGTCFEDGL